MCFPYFFPYLFHDFAEILFKDFSTFFWCLAGQKKHLFLPTKKNQWFLWRKTKGFFLLKKIGFFDFFQVFQGLLPIGLAFSAGLRTGPTSQRFFFQFFVNDDHPNGTPYYGVGCVGFVEVSKESAEKFVG